MSNLQLIYDYETGEPEATNYYILWNNDQHKEGKIYLIYSQDEPRYFATVSYYNNHIAPYYCSETGHLYDSLSYLCEQMEAYYKKQAEIRRKAIEWQLKISEKNLSYDELSEASLKWEKLGKEYGLTEEFIENGII